MSRPFNPIIRGTPGNDGLTGTVGNDTIDGGPGDDGIYGAPSSGPTPGFVVNQWRRDGADLLRGGPGDDSIFGAGGDDTIKGGPGDDTIRGSIGADLMSGGPGADTFQFGFLAPPNFFTPDSGVGEGQRDIIQDFRSGQDKIVLNGDTGYFFGVSNLTITDMGGHVKLVSFGANFPTGPIPQEIEVHGTIGLGDFIL
jgi:Ca2+-binding RTX toxin-like protein